MRAAGDGDGIGGNVLEVWRRMPQVVRECEANGFFDADSSGANATVCKGCCGQLCGAFILLPGAHLKGEAQFLAEAALFEGGDDDDGATRARKDQAQQSFAQAPTDAGEIVERG